MHSTMLNPDRLHTQARTIHGPERVKNGAGKEKGNGQRRDALFFSTKSFSRRHRRMGRSETSPSRCFDEHPAGIARREKESAFDGSHRFFCFFFVLFVFLFFISRSRTLFSSRSGAFSLIMYEYYGAILFFRDRNVNGTRFGDRVQSRDPLRRRSITKSRRRESALPKRGIPPQKEARK